MKKEVSNKIANLNFIFTVGIVIYHFRWLFDFNLKYLNFFDNIITNLFLNVCDKFGFLSMSFFFMLSGFLYYFNISSSSDAIFKIKKRIKTLFIPYFLWFIITLLYLLTKDNNVISKSFFDIFFLNPIDGPMWYCLALLLLMIPSPLIILLKNRKKICTIIMVVIIILLNLRLFGVIKPIFIFSDWWWYENMIGYLQPYIIGVYFALLFSDYIINPHKSVFDNNFSKIIVLLIFVLFSFLSVKFNAWSLKQLCYMVIIACVWLLSNFKFLNIRKFKLSNISFVLFAIHQPILIPEVNNILFYFFGKYTLCGFTFILIKILGVILMVAFCYLIVFLLKKIKCDKVLYYLSGGRIK